MKYMSVPGWPEKTCLKNLRRKKETQEIWGGPGATYVSRQVSKQITQNCNRQKQSF